MITTPKIMNTAVLSFKRTNSNLEQIGHELVECFLYKSTNPKMKKIIDRISELSTFGFLENIPGNRITNGIAKMGDFQFQYEIQKLIKSNVIDSETMVISSTGHDIPMLAQLYKNEHLKFDFAFQFKFKEDDGSKTRIIEQANTWGNQIKQAKLKLGNNSNGLFVGIDAHRNWKIDIAQLPSAQELKDLGIKKVVHLIEANPKKDFSYENTDELKEYYINLEKEGLNVLYKGVDSRYQDKIDSKIKPSFNNFDYIQNNKDLINKFAQLLKEQ